MKRVIALTTFFFLFLTTLESWAFIWIAGRWFMSSRYGSITLGTVKRWLERGLITRTTNQVKIFVNRNGKWIILTVGLSTVLPEVLRRLEASRYCYALHSPTGASAIIQSYSSRVYVSYADSPRSSNFWTYDYSCSGWSRDGSDPNAVRFPLYYVYRLPDPGYSGLSFWTYLPAEGTYTLRSRDRDPVTCTVTIRWLLPLRECNTPEDRSWENERRDVPVRIYPNPLDFVRPDIVENDPALRYLRDEYNRIANDPSIPNVSSDLVGLSLPQIGWSIPPEEAIDSDAESSERSRPSTGSSDRPEDRDTPRNEDRPRDEDLPSPPGFDTSLPSLEKRSFPVGLINSVVQSHPLLRVLQNVNLDVGGGGSCQIGSGVFTINFCNYAWVLNLMGAIIVPVAFLIGLFGWRND